MKETKLFNLKCEDRHNIYNITIEAENIDKAIDLAKEYLAENNLEPLSIWEV